MNTKTAWRNSLGEKKWPWKSEFEESWPNKTTWQDSLSDEVQYWRSLFDGSCPDKSSVSAFHERVTKNRPFQTPLERLVRHVNSDVVRVLDVGAGPMTHVGTLYKKRKIEVTAIDPLAREYDLLFGEFNLVPRIRTRTGYAERLSDIFSENSFDLVFCRNALDHSYDPLSGIFQMIRVCKIDSYCWLQHAVNEGEKQHYQGLHQWNFFPDRDDLIISGKPGTQSTSLTKELSGIATVSVEAKIWCTVKIRKLCDVSV